MNMRLFLAGLPECAAFGRVVSGMDVFKAIHVLPAEGQTLKPPVRIVSVRRLER